MRPLLMRCFFALVGLLLAGTIAAFLHAVSLWSILMVSLVLLGMALAFMLGVFAGSGMALPWHRRQQQPSNQPFHAPAGSVRSMGQDRRKPQSQPEILTFHR
jgi:hypothetical protein